MAGGGSQMSVIRDVLPTSRRLECLSDSKPKASLGCVALPDTEPWDRLKGGGFRMTQFD